MLVDEESCSELMRRVEVADDLASAVREAAIVFEAIIDDAAVKRNLFLQIAETGSCLLYTSPSPRDATLSRMPSSA